MRVEASREANIDIERLWSVVASVERYPVTRGTILSTERVYGVGVQPGARWREQRRFLTHLAFMDVTVMESTPLAYLKVVGDWEGDQVESEFLLAPSAGGTRLTVAVEVISGSGGHFGSGLAALGGKITPAMLRDVNDRDVADLTAAARI